MAQVDQVLPRWRVRCPSRRPNHHRHRTNRVRPSPTWSEGDRDRSNAQIGEHCPHGRRIGKPRTHMSRVLQNTRETGSQESNEKGWGSLRIIRIQEVFWTNVDHSRLRT